MQYHENSDIRLRQRKTIIKELESSVSCIVNIFKKYIKNHKNTPLQRGGCLGYLDFLVKNGFGGKMG